MLSTNYSGTITTEWRGLSSTRADIVTMQMQRPLPSPRIGTGTLGLFSGASTYSGATGGKRPALSQSPARWSSPVTVNSGATLTVSGKVGGLTLRRGSTLTTLGMPADNDRHRRCRASPLARR